MQQSTTGHKGWQPSMKEVAGFMNTQQLGRIATLGDDDQPQIANVAFSQNDKLEIIIGTSETSRKAQNIMRNPRVAFETNDGDRRYTVQFEGIARPLSKDAFNSRADAHFKKLPSSLPFKDIKGQVHFLLTPLWARFSDCSVGPWKVTEFEFDKKED